MCQLSERGAVKGEAGDEEGTIGAGGDPKGRNFGALGDQERKSELYPPVENKSELYPFEQVSALD